MSISVQEFAAKAHEGQRYGEHSYDYHLANVEAVLRRFGFQDQDLVTAAWLHDSVEDAGVSIDEISSRFGSDVAALVFAVTDGEGSNRSERKVASYQKMNELPRAIILKLADRITNVENSVENNAGLLQMYRNEHPSFTEHLLRASPAESLKMWAHLNELLA